MINLFKETGIILRTHGKESSPFSLKTVAPSVPTVLSLDNGVNITNPYDTVNNFNNYFASIAETTKKASSIQINIFQTIFQMKVVVHYFCNLLVKKK